MLQTVALAAQQVHTTRGFGTMASTEGLARVTVCVAVMLNVCEFFTNFADELEYIWKSIHNITIMKASYLVARYFTFAIHYQVFLNSGPERNLEIFRSSTKVAAWTTYKFMTCQTLILVIDVALMKRVYLLSNKHRGMFLFLVSLAVVRMVYVSCIAYSCYEVLRMTLSTTAALPAPHLITYVSGEFILQCILLFLSLRYAHQSRKRRTPVITRLMAFGIEQLVVVMTLTLGVALLSFGSEPVAFLFPLVIGSLSAAGCRLIMKMQRAAHRNSPTMNRILYDEEDSEDEVG